MAVSAATLRWPLLQWPDDVLDQFLFDHGDVFALGCPAGIGVVGGGQAELAGRDSLVVGVPL
ncbi:hypothetical protein ABZS96_44590, partial [Streptomyces avermitilis]